MNPSHPTDTPETPRRPASKANRSKTTAKTRSTAHLALLECVTDTSAELKRKTRLQPSENATDIIAIPITAVGGGYHTPCHNGLLDDFLMGGLRYTPQTLLVAQINYESSTPPFRGMNITRDIMTVLKQRQIKQTLMTTLSSESSGLRWG